MDNAISARAVRLGAGVATKYHAYIYGMMLRKADGTGRVFQTAQAAETAATIITPAQARDFAIAWRAWQADQSLSYGEMAEWSAYFAALVGRFPELAEEFRENGVR